MVESANRKFPSWIDEFVNFSSNLHAPPIFRKWAAISAIGAVLEQKVWLTTSSPIYPNLYTLICGHPGTGKTRSIRSVKAYLDEVPEFKFAPNSFTFPSLVDALVRAKRTIILLPDPPMEYNTLTIMADEIGTFLQKYEREMSDGISAFYDPMPYGHERRGNDVRIKIKSPQLNLLCGLTPSTMMDVIPEHAWGQGLMSRMVMIFADEHIIGDDFAITTRDINPDLLKDLLEINNIMGEFKVTEDYKSAVMNWKKLGQPPQPTHPKLIHYNSRRTVTLYKLSMIASIDRSNVLLLDKAAFNTALGWMLEAEERMPEIFDAGTVGSDGKVMEELVYFMKSINGGTRVPEHLINNQASRRLPIHAAAKILDVMEKAGLIRAVAIHPRTGMRLFDVVKAGSID